MLNSQNILPYDGEVYYEKCIWDKPNAENLLREMQQHLHWQHDELMMFGKKITTNRKVAWYGDKAFTYTYSRATKSAIPWHPLLLPIREKTETVTNASFNACLCNLYHHGNEGMTWHSDDDKEFGINPTIASLSFGAERTFSFRHKITKEVISIILENGSVLLMKSNTQTHWVHALTKSAKIKDPRINLTFRLVV
jgi:alkylated DNA repair dioxygenase AlkB